MGKHTADYFRERRQLQRIARGLEPSRDFVHAERFVKRGKELAMLEQLPTLPWPRDLYRDYTAKAQPMQQQNGGVKLADDKCACGCGNPHRNNIPMTLRSTYGHGFNVIYFVLDSHKSRWVKENSERL